MYNFIMKIDYLSVGLESWIEELIEVYLCKVQPVKYYVIRSPKYYLQLQLTGQLMNKENKTYTKNEQQKIR